jgi:hypothetical protein
MSDFHLCLRCEARFPLEKSVCPECGSDRKTRWLDEAPSRAEPEGGTGSRGIFTKRWVVPVGVVMLALILFFPQLLNIPMGAVPLTPYLIVIAVAIVAGAIYYFKRTRLKGPIILERPDYMTLLRKTRGDVALAERLIEYERRRNPYASRDEHIHEAIDRLDRDRSF